MNNIADKAGSTLESKREYHLIQLPKEEWEELEGVWPKNGICYTTQPPTYSKFFPIIEQGRLLVSNMQQEQVDIYYIVIQDSQ